MGTGEDRTDTPSPAVTGDARLCRACRQPIHPDATVCHHCGSAQGRSPWQAVGTFLKWVGGVTAVISLLMGSVQVRRMFQDWRERKDSVQELVEAARLQGRGADYAGAWNLLDDALRLDPSSPQARGLQVELAMEWVRNLRVRREETFTEIVERLTPVLARGAATAEGERAADVLAHLGWANYLRRREGMSWVAVDDHFRRALARDPDNVYAHAMWGYWLLWKENREPYEGDPFRLGVQHFQEALATGRQRSYVEDLYVHALRYREYESRAQREALRFAAALQKEERGLDAVLRAMLLRTFETFIDRHRKADREPLVREFGAEKLLTTFLWLSRDLDPEKTRDYGLSPTEQLLVRARLTEAAGDLREALELYRAAHAAFPEASVYRELIRQDMARLGGQGSR